MSRHTPAGLWRICVLAGACLVICPAAALAQTVRGRVVDAVTELPLQSVEIAVFAGARQVAHSRTDSTGRFQYAVPGSGAYRMRAIRIGYRPLDSMAVEVGIRELVDVTLRMSASAVVLTPLVVRERRIDPRHLATYEGLYARRALLPQVGSSRAVLRDDPELASAGTLTDVLKWFTPRKRCVVYFVDGVRRTAVAARSIPVVLLEGVEYYKHDHDAPLELRDGGLTCSNGGSVIAVWRRRPGM